MPELPEVEFNRQIIHRHCLNRQIRKVSCLEDKKIFSPSGKELEDALIGKTINDTGRHGKYFWCCFKDPSTYLLLHLGMTGFVQVKDKKRSYYKSAPEKEKDTKEGELDPETWPPRFVKITIIFSDNTELIYGDSRRFGRIKYIFPLPFPSMIEYLTKQLGFDPINNLPAKSCQLNLDKKKVPLKSLLLDQSFCAGIGNWMADDILYSSGLHPLTLACNLSEYDKECLLKSIKFISEKACELRLKGSPYPKEWLFNCRWNFKRNTSSITHNGEKIGIIKVAGRTTLFSPSKQKKGNLNK